MDPVKNYPGHLNPFGDDEDEAKDQDNYPDHLDPFGDDGDKGGVEQCEGDKKRPSDEYDASLNPFGDEDPVGEKRSIDSTLNGTSDVRPNDQNPFDDTDITQKKSRDESEKVSIANDETNTANKISLVSHTQSFESLEPPKPLPRTKSLLKKEQALRRLQQEQQNLRAPSSMNVTDNLNHSNNSTNSPSTNVDSTNSFQRKKNKRVAPPVPVNFKRQVSGSLDAIEEELNGIGDELLVIERESIECQNTLKAPEANEQAALSATKTKYIELIKRKSSIVKRQKELMYRKRELKLDQIYSDIEYELRMIGNKQLSTRTIEDEAKEKELLKKLVDIVEEKNDIVENLNKDTSRDNQDIEDAFKRLGLVSGQLEKKSSAIRPTTKPPSPPVIKNASKSENCDRMNLNKLSKIATLLPKSNTIKGTIKLKRKRLFKKTNDPQAKVERDEGRKTEI